MADEIMKRRDVNGGVAIETTIVEPRNRARGHIPLMVERILIGVFDVRGRLVVGPVQRAIDIGYSYPACESV